MIPFLVCAGLLVQAASLPPSRSQPGKHESLTSGARPSRSTIERWPVEGEVLARTQAADGSWGSGDARLETTGIALLAFLRLGVTTWDPKDLPLSAGRGARSPAGVGMAGFQVLRRGIEYLLLHQDADGFIGNRAAPGSFRAHALAATVLSEACCLGRVPLLRQPAEQAIHALVAEALPSTCEDAVAVGWVILALRSATLNSLPFDRGVYDRLVPNLRPPSGRAVELLLWVHLGRVGRLPPDLRRAAPATDLPSDTAADRYWGTKALLWFDGPEGPLWRRWKKRTGPEPSSGEGVEGTALRALTITTTWDSWTWGAQ